MTSTNLSLVIRAVEERNGNQVVHWQTRDSLDTLDAVEIADGETATTTVSVDIPTILNRTEAIQNDLGAAPGQTEVLLVADTTVESSVIGETFTDTRTDRIEIVPGRSVYRVALPQPERPPTTRPCQLLATIDARLTAYLAELCRLHDSTLPFRSSSRLRASAHEFERARNDFDEWISTARIPDADDRTPVPTDSR